MKPVSNICRLFIRSHLTSLKRGFLWNNVVKFSAQNSNKTCFSTVSYQRCMERLIQNEKKSVNLQQRVCASFISYLNVKSGHLVDNCSERGEVIPRISYIPVRTMAGHSHYANIKDTKERMDRMRSLKYTAFIPKIVNAIRDQKSVNPSVNTALDRVMKEGKRLGIPLSVMEKAIKREEKRLKSGGNATEQHPFELMVSGGVMMILVSSDYSKGKNYINSVIKKFPDLKRGSCKSMFEHKGILTVILDANVNVDMDKYLEVAIEIGAEDVELEKGEEGDQILKFTCAPTNVDRIKRELESQDLKVLSADAVYIPSVTIEVDENQMTLLGKIIDKCLESDYVSDVFMNAVLE